MVSLVGAGSQLITVILLPTQWNTREQEINVHKKKTERIGHRKYCFVQQRIALLLVSLYFHFLLHLQFLQFLSFPNHVKFLFPFFSGRVCYKVLERIMPEKLVLRKENLLMAFLLDCILFLLFLCCCFWKVESSCDEREKKKWLHKKQVFKTCLEFVVEYKALHL